VVFKDVWINPGEYFPVRVKKDHILIDDKRTIPGSKSRARRNDGPGIAKGSFIGVQFFEAADGFSFQIISPDLLSVIVELFSNNNFGSAFDVILLSSQVSLSFFWVFQYNLMANSVASFH
jgi:hypothetical protein